ncbi:hypothetical protein [Cellulomonas sp. APG4]|uniref:hypothetical protein n=1 Tax=Cellulomonas sp. APG4 TaxID=1538656 RepID=UPI001ED96DBC|nr:hypothetical protein [Cellulomonas sp. APG4]
MGDGRRGVRLGGARTVMWRTAAVVGLLGIGPVLAACAPGTNDAVRTVGESGTVAGFWFGLWHGFISPITFVISLFTESVGIYEIHNNGGWYDFGFLIGVSIFFGGSAGGGSRAKRR